MTLDARLQAEQWPTGTFGHARPPKPLTEPWTPAEQAQHLATLARALKGWHDPSNTAEADRNRHRPPHLRLIQPHTTEDAA